MQPINVNPFWFFVKIGVLCSLSFVVAMQAYALFRLSNTTTNPTPADIMALSHVSAESEKDKRTLPKTREQVRQELAEMVKKGLQNTVKKRSKPPLGEALLDANIYAVIKSALMHDLDEPYGKLYKHLGLDTERLQKLRGLLVEKELGMLEGYELARVSKISLDSEELTALRNEQDGAILELLGDVGFSHYKYYEDTLATRNHVDILEKRLSYKTEPLTSDQYGALVSALDGLPDSNIKPGSGAWLGFYSPIITQDSLKVAKGVLTPSQFVIYEMEYERIQTDIMITEQYSKKFSEAQKNQRAKINAKLSQMEVAP